jgi:hypothetical protein
VAIADRAGNRTTREIQMGDAIAPSAPASRVGIDRGRPDPTLMPKDADPSIPSPSLDKEVRGAGFPDLPKAPADIPALPDVPPVKAPDLAPEIKLPDSPAVMPPRIPGGSDLKIPEPPPAKSPSEPIKNSYTSDVPLPAGGSQPQTAGRRAATAERAGRQAHIGVEAERRGPAGPAAARYAKAR